MRLTKMTLRLTPALAIIAGTVCFAGFPGLNASAKATSSSSWRLSAKIVLRGKTVVMESVAAVNVHSAWAAGIAAKRKRPEGEAVIEHWSGRGWHLVKVPGKVLASFDLGPRGFSGPPSVTMDASSDRNVWVFNQLTGAWIRWDGVRWQAGRLPVQAGSTDTAITTALVIAPNDNWALGASVSATGQTRPYAARFNGRRWMTTVLPACLALPVSGVSAVSAGGIWATVGYAGQIFFPPQGNGGAFVHWNGHSWRVLALSDHDIWVAGGHPGRDKDGDLTEMVEHWNGSSWHSTTPTAPRVEADCVIRSVTDSRTGLLGLTDCFSDANPGHVWSRFWALSSGRWVGPTSPHLADGAPTFIDLAGTKGSGAMWAVGYLGDSGIVASCGPANC